MRVFALTKLGKRVTSTGGTGTDEMKILQYIRDNKTADDAQLETVGEAWLVRRLKSNGLVKELTTE
jgi:hypothetical protein